SLDDLHLAHDAAQVRARHLLDSRKMRLGHFLVVILRLGYADQVVRILAQRLAGARSRTKLALVPRLTRGIGVIGRSGSYGQLALELGQVEQVNRLVAHRPVLVEGARLDDDDRDGLDAFLLEELGGANRVRAALLVAFGLDDDTRPVLVV